MTGESNRPSSLPARSKIAERLATYEIGRWPFVLLASGFVGLAAYLRLLPLTAKPLPFAADIERLYRLAAFSTWDHLLNPQDYHHPGLWFALLHWPFELSHHSFLVPAALDRLCAVLAVPVAGVIVERYAGRLAALGVMLNVALLPFLTAEARELSDVTLFILLGLASLAAYGSARARPTAGRLLMLVATLALAVNASYAAPVLVGALLVDALCRRPRSGAVLATVVLAALPGVPRFWHVARLLPTELSMRSTLGQLTVTHWANVSVGHFAADAARDYFTSAFPYVLPVLIAALWVGRSALFRYATELSLTALAYVAFLCTQPFLRMRPYYASLLPVTLLALVNVLAGVRGRGESMAAAGRRRTLAVIASAACSLAFAYYAAQPRPDIFQADEIDAKNAIQAALDDGATRLASSNWTETTWYFFADPIGTMTACIRHDAGTRCRPAYAYDEDRRSGRRYYSLWNTTLPGDPEQTIDTLRQLQMSGVTHLLLDRRSPIDVAMFSYAERSCAAVRHVGLWELWRCPQLDSSDRRMRGSRMAGNDGRRREPPRSQKK